MGLFDETERVVKATRVGIVGAGPMGRLHARTVFGLAEKTSRCVLTAVVDHHEGRAEAIAAEFGAMASKHLEEVMLELDAAVVCVPTAMHFKVAEQLLEHGVDVLVEKPLATSIVEGRGLGALALDRDRILQAGHVEWYNQGWREAARRAGQPRSIEVERMHPETGRGLDLDVVQDLMLHDLDWVTRFMDEEVIDIEARGRAVSSPRLDEAEATLRFAGGCVARLRVSRVHTARLRRVRFEGPEGMTTADLLTRRVNGPGSDRGAGQDPLEAQCLDFLESVESRRAPVVDAGAGVAVLEMVDRVRGAISKTTGSLDRDDDSAFSG